VCAQLNRALTDAAEDARTRTPLASALHGIISGIHSQTADAVNKSMRQFHQILSDHYPDMRGATTMYRTASRFGDNAYSYSNRQLDAWEALQRIFFVADIEIGGAVRSDDVVYAFHTRLSELLPPVQSSLASETLSVIVAGARGTFTEAFHRPALALSFPFRVRCRLLSVEAIALWLCSFVDVCPLRAFQWT
jgi:hypothetical protein